MTIFFQNINSPLTKWGQFDPYLMLKSHSYIIVSQRRVKEQNHKSSKRRIKSKKNNQSDLIDLMRKSISIGNKSNPTMNINFENLNEAKGVIASISNELDFHQKKTIKLIFNTIYNILSSSLQIKSLFWTNEHFWEKFD